MPKVSLKNKEIIDSLTHKLDHDPFNFTIRDQFELEAAEDDRSIEDYHIHSTLKEYIDNLPDKDQSILLYREDSPVYLILDQLGLLNDISFTHVASDPRTLKILKAESGDINFTIVHYFGTETWIFSKSEINKLKTQVKNTILSKLLTSMNSIRSSEIESYARAIKSVLD